MIAQWARLPLVSFVSIVKTIVSIVVKMEGFSTELANIRKTSGLV